MFRLKIKFNNADGDGALKFHERWPLVRAAEKVIYKFCGSPIHANGRDRGRRGGVCVCGLLISLPLAVGRFGRSA